MICIRQSFYANSPFIRKFGVTSTDANCLQVHGLSVMNIGKNDMLLYTDIVNGQ